MSDNGTVAIVVAPGRWEAFRKRLLSSRRSPGDETLGFLFCRRHDRPSGARFLVVDDHVPASEAYSAQSHAGIALGNEAHGAVLDRCLGDGLHPVHVHTHPTPGPQSFSATDDTYEKAYAKALDQLPGRPTLLSVVLDVDGRHPVARAWSASDDAVLATLERVDGSRDHPPTPRADDPAMARQTVFGEIAQGALADMHVAVVGCGGIGAMVTELTTRLGVRAFTFVDFDALETTNLNRIPGARARDVRNRMAKVDHACRLVATMWGDEAHTRALRTSIEAPKTQRRVAEADVIVVATDNHSSRLLATELALRFLRPVILAASHIDVIPGGDQPRAFARVTVPPLDGGWCPACAEVLDPGQAALETADSALRATLKARGYIGDAPAPAVYWLNALAASLATKHIHDLAIGCASGGADHIIDAGAARWLTLDHEPVGCWYCDPAGEVLGSARLP